MSLFITRAGLQTTIQAKPRLGQRHLGVPASGPADPLSMALANHLVGNALMAPALETTLTGIDLRFEVDTCIAITGAPSAPALNGSTIDFHQTHRISAGDDLHIGSAAAGARVYVAVAGGLIADDLLGSRSTYLPAAFGGHAGRAIRKGDYLDIQPIDHDVSAMATPLEFQPPIVTAWAARACVAMETGMLDESDVEQLFDTNFTIGARNDRMGMQLQGRTFNVNSSGRLLSAAVFPGCVQCPENGEPYLLSVDAQTTGGYPRIAQVARVDRHVLGQFRTGDHLRLLQRSPQQAAEELHEKLDYWREWLPDIESVI